MTASSLLRNFLIFFCLKLFLLSAPGALRGGTSEDPVFQSIETRFAILHYQNIKDLKKFDGKIAYFPGAVGLKWLSPRKESNKPMDKLKRKVDNLFERTQEILGMRKRMKKVNINIYHDKKQLDAAYWKIFKKARRSRAWYTQKYNTIYINLDDLDEKVLAHEMAHHIIDHYLTVRPPAPSAEILSNYVQTHLYHR